MTRAGLLLLAQGCFAWIPGARAPGGDLYDADASDAPTTDDRPGADVPVTDAPAASDHTLYLTVSYTDWGPDVVVGVLGDAQWRLEEEFGDIVDGCRPLFVPPARDALPADGGTLVALVAPDVDYPLAPYEDGWSGDTFRSNGEGISQLPHRQDVGVDVRGWPGVPDVRLPELLRLPPANWLQVLSPPMDRFDLGDPETPTWGESFSVSWETYAESADAVLIRVSPLLGDVEAPGVVCVARDDGEFRVPDADFPTFEAPTLVSVEVSRLKREESYETLDDGARQRRVAYARAYRVGEFCLGDCSGL